MILKFTVIGRPRQRGSKVPFVARRKDGSIVMKDNGAPVIAVTDSSKHSKEWMSQVRDSAHEAMAQHELMRGPIRLSIAFYFARPKGHFRTGKNAASLKDSAPQFHTQTPDLAKLVRCLEDALKGVVWGDDNQVCQYGEIFKDWTLSAERAEVMIETLS